MWETGDRSQQHPRTNHLPSRNHHKGHHLLRSPVTPNPPGTGATQPAPYQGPSDAGPPSDMSLEGMDCTYSTNGNYPSCTLKAELWVKTSKYKAMCRSCASWVFEQQDSSRKYANSEASASPIAASWPPAVWGSSGTTTAPQVPGPSPPPPHHEVVLHRPRADQQS